MASGEQPAPGEPAGRSASDQGEWVLHVATQLANAELPPRGPDRRVPRWVFALLAGIGVLAAVLVVIVVVAGGDDGDDPVSAAPDATEPTAVATTLAPATTPAGDDPSESPATTAGPADPATTAAPTTAPPATTGAPTTVAPTTVAPTTTVPLDPTAPPVRWAEFSGGVVYLRGRVPDQATADEVATKAGAVVGEGNVVVEYTIDPAAPRPPSAPLYVYDSILFDPGQAVLNDTAIATLELGVSLLGLYPQVTFDIEGHTDDVGSDEQNLALSQRRVDVILGYLTERGVDPSRLTAVAKGESEPIADNATEAGKARNRRIEISVNNLLG